MRYARAEIELAAEKRTWREYVGNSLYFIPQNQGMATMYSDILQPPPVITQEQAADAAIRIINKAKGGL